MLTMTTISWLRPTKLARYSDDTTYELLIQSVVNCSCSCLSNSYRLQKAEAMEAKESPNLFHAETLCHIRAGNPSPFACGSGDAKFNPASKIIKLVALSLDSCLKLGKVHARPTASLPGLGLRMIVEAVLVHLLRSGLFLGH
jgi:hypothetical protein